MSLEVKLAIFMALVLLPSVVIHEYAHAWSASKLGDWSSRRWGRMTLDPRPHIDKFGTLLLPALLLILVAAGNLVPVFAYAKPQPYDPAAMRNPSRGAVWWCLAGPLANLALAVAFGLGLRATGSSAGATVTIFLFAGLVVNVVLFVFNLLPFPGLDGAKLVARVLPPRARQVYQGLDEYLPLFMLLVFFLLAAPALSIVRVLGNAVCRLIGVGDCLP
ncbi:MAG: site-2 protease family protein [Actinomycetota bacterium]